MFKNYVMTAYKVLLRRKFFTFIGLFGIALTLTVLLVLSTLLDNYLYPTGPEKNNQHFLSIDRLKLVSESGNNNTNSRPGYWFLDKNVKRLKMPEKISLFSATDTAASYLAGTKLSNELRHTDAVYWDILDFEFIEGQSYSKQAVASGAMQMVISSTTAKAFFGDTMALGKTIVVNEQKFTVVGVVKDVSVLESSAYADMWAPYTTLASTHYQREMIGGWEALIYHPNTNMRQQMQQEFVNMLKHDLVTSDPKMYHTAFAGADTALEKVARKFSGSQNYDSGVGRVISFVVFVTLCFMLLPSINLINLNISRIMERASEIGVRKAFGASSGQLVLQFIVENLIVTAMGAVIGLLLSALVLIQIEATNLLPSVDLAFSLHTFIYGLVLIVVFGLLSGVYPAYKMSKLHPVAALKGGSQSC
jgi:putative ABC transport system permease protein